MPGEVKVTIPQELTNLLARMTDKQVKGAMAAASKAVAPVLTRALVEQSQAKAGSGDFSKAWLAQPKGDDAPGLSITNKAPAARSIEFPTKPHIIKARPGGVLAWVPGRGAFSAFNAAKAKAGSAWVYAKQVSHPGTRGKYVLAGTLKVEAPKLFKAMVDACKNALKGA